MKSFLAMLAALTVASAAKAESDQWGWNHPPNTLEIGFHVIAQATILLDGWTSLDIKNHKNNGPGFGAMEESNPLLGKHPSDLKLVGGTLAAMAATTVLWYVLPQEARWLVDVVTIGTEGPRVYGNFTQFHLSLTVPFN